MPIFVHISDIHFGQEKRTGEVIVNNDVKERLITDARRTLDAIGKYPAAGIIVTGDIAYAGKVDEYKRAAEWLDRLAEAIGCSKASVHLVPGNHDIDRDEIGSGLELMLREVGEKGEPLLDHYLAREPDRKEMYARFAAYIPFAEGYNCPLDRNGGLAGDKPVHLGDGKSLRFIGLNTALTCSKGKGEEGHLIVGERQRVLPMEAGQELVVLAHHPMRWLLDGADAFSYIKNRARLLITGHEHNPTVDVEGTPDGGKLLVLAAGATVPPSNEVLLYTYNVIEFGLDATGEKLVVTVHPRSWDHERKNFVADTSPLKGQDPTFTLDCPNFCSGLDGGASAQSEDDVAQPQETVVAAPAAPLEAQSTPMPDDFALVLLKFFRDLTPGQRLKVLVRLGELPDDWTEELSHAIERQVVDDLGSSGRLQPLSEAIEWVLSEEENGGKTEHG
ncbi:calcineurin-like phosphoesterase family protein [Caulobacter ginsengisoli]|uniref:Calcineurin-like phosphoesterase family protein n=1 Tax=Caulobacter ginsengisoli TaxID=400775 RepID=A0ABU0IYW5_9CAUL|nr:metallophosphoesterase [Caulobacter ginsengisoli]MDQ0466244.1 calcineurin-like phosphoesterase family protein [Caulobacter ginsengisoli]